MKKHSRKLNLNRETLIPLTSDALDGIHGGLTPTTGTLTVTTHTSTVSTLTTQTRWLCTQSQVSLNNK